MQSPPVFRFSTEAIPARERLAIWREVIGEQYMSLDVNPEDPASFRAELAVHQLPSMPVTHLSSTPMKYARTRFHAQKDDSDFTFVFSPRGVFHFDGEGEETTFHPGEGVLLSNNRTGTITSVDGERVVTVRINGPMIRSAFRQIDERLINRLDAGNKPLQVVTAYIDTLLSGDAVTPAMGMLASSHIADLLAFGLRPSADTRERAQASAVPAARLAAMRADILANLADLDLSTTALAQRHGVSERYVHLLFEQNELSFNRFITNERLKRAMAILLDPAQASLRISDIAFAVGFGDLTTFNRAFRRRYGDTPRAVRAAQRTPF